MSLEHLMEHYFPPTIGWGSSLGTWNGRKVCSEKTFGMKGWTGIRMQTHQAGTRGYLKDQNMHPKQCKFIRPLLEIVWS